jgi:hypothetical protein
MSGSLGDAEREALGELESELNDHLALTMRVFNLVQRALGLFGSSPLRQVPAWRLVATSLLLRLLNDLRCASLLAARGYASQACSLTASVYEATVTVLSIGRDNARAEKWIEHDDPVRWFDKIPSLTRKAIRNLASIKPGPIADPAQEANRMYLTYRQLCLPKHLNPVFERQRGYVVDTRGGTWAVLPGPDTSDAGVRAAWFALERGADCAFKALAGFVTNAAYELPDSEDLRRVKADMISIGEELLRLNKRAVDRWGSENPFPNRWKV